MSGSVVWCCRTLVLAQVSETEREDLEESEKVQHWVERLCQTRLEQITCVESESPEVQMPPGASAFAFITPVQLSCVEPCTNVGERSYRI